MLVFEANASFQCKSGLVTGGGVALPYLCGLRMADVYDGWSVSMPFHLRNILYLAPAVEHSNFTLLLSLHHPVYSRHGWARAIGKECSQMISVSMR